MASHGHALVNGRRVTIPSIQLKEGDIVSVREGSKKSALFTDVSERMKTLAAPAWLTVDPDKSEAKVVGLPMYVPSEHVFDLGVVLEYYSR